LLHRGMTDAPDGAPRKRKHAKRAARDERLAEALRDNLRRRKEQVRMRAANAGRKPADAPALSGEPFPSKSNGHRGSTVD
jgi:hypothetical protein